MKKFIAQAKTHLTAFVNNLQLKRVFSVVLVGFLVFGFGFGSNRGNEGITSKIDKDIHQGDSNRPKTTGEWQQEAKETEGSPGKRLKRITDQSAEAVKDFGSIYPDTAKRTIPALQDEKKR